MPTVLPEAVGDLVTCPLEPWELEHQYPWQYAITRGHTKYTTQPNSLGGSQLLSLYSPVLSVSVLYLRIPLRLACFDYLLWFMISFCRLQCYVGIGMAGRS